MTAETRSDRNPDGHPERPVRLNDGLDKRLTAYAAAAAGVGVLTLAQPAHADSIVFTPVNVTLVSSFATSGTLLIDLNHNGTPDFLLTAPFAGGRYDTVNLSAAGLTPGASLVKASSRLGLAALTRGQKIGSSRVFEPGNYMAVATVGGAEGGLFANTTDRFLGLRFGIGGQVHYGWIGFGGVTVCESTSCQLFDSITAQVTGYAYDTVAGQAITAGQGQTPEPGTLGLLALGSLGLGFWRRRKAGITA